MRIIDIQHRDVYFLLEVSAREAAYLKDLFDHAEIEYDSNQEPEMAEAVKYMKEKLYPTLQQIEKSLQQQENS